MGALRVAVAWPSWAANLQCANAPQSSSTSDWGWTRTEVQPHHRWCPNTPEVPPSGSIIFFTRVLEGLSLDASLPSDASFDAQDPTWPAEAPVVAQRSGQSRSGNVYRGRSGAFEVLGFP